MRVKIPKTRYLGVIVVGLMAVLAMGASPGAARSVQDAVDDVLRQFEARKISSVDAYGRLKELPDEAVVAALVAALNREPGLIEGPHNFSYRMLRAKHAARTEVGFQQLVSGLWKPEIAPDCAEALLDAPAEKQAEAFEHIRRYLAETKTPPEPEEVNGRRAPPSRKQLDFRNVLRAIARKAKDAHAYVDVLDAILRDPERDVNVRTAAAEAIVMIKPLSEALKHFENLDDAGMEAALKARLQPVGELMQEARKAGKSFRNEYPELLLALRKLVLKGLQSPRPETQAAALEPMGLVYGNDLVVIRSPEDYEYNPQLRPMLENMARNHPDEGVRSSVRRLIAPETVDLLVTNILRERERQAQQKDQDP